MGGSTISEQPAAGPPDDTAAGHRVLAHTADCIIEAWGPDRSTCLVEALLGLVEEFAKVPDASATAVLPLHVDPAGAEDQLIALCEDVIYALDVFAVVPVRFHLAETESGGIAGDMEIVPVAQVELVGPIPKAAAYHELSMGPVAQGWRCRVLVDV